MLRSSSFFVLTLLAIFVASMQIDAASSQRFARQVSDGRCGNGLCINGGTCINFGSAAICACPSATVTCTQEAGTYTTTTTISTTAGMLIIVVLLIIVEALVFRQVCM